ncbi:SRPBCC domain-containing protein [Georhizobium profundi]|uniref:SRPBCC domain-containing protein n=1 Tax=Georhizobium profundi TaxID=2341112 RepID=UPI003CCB2236
MPLWTACSSPSQRFCPRASPIVRRLAASLAPGGRYTLTRSSTEGTILECEPDRRLAITWEYQGDVSRVDVDLVPANKKWTMLRVSHHVLPNDHWETYGPAAAGVGWEESLRALSLYLAGDADVLPMKCKNSRAHPMVKI